MVSILGSNRYFSVVGKKCILIVLSVVMLSSCGQIGVRGDTYPHIPIFPKSTNKDIRIESFAYIEREVYGNGTYLYAWGEGVSRNSKKGLMIFNKNFDLIKLIEKKNGFEIKSYMDSRNGIYVYSPESLKVSKAFRIEIPSLHKKKIPIIDMHGNDNRGINKKYEDLESNLQCIIQLYQENYIFEYPNRSVIVRLKDAHKLFHYKYRCKEGSIVQAKRAADSFDKTVMSKRDVGYYGLGVKTSFGYDYIHLNVGSKHAKTKVYNSNGQAGLEIMYEDKKRMIVRPTEEKYYYLIRTK